MKARRHYIHVEASFNLVELSLAVAIVAIGILSVFGILPHVIRSSRKAVEYSALSMLIHDQVEDPSHWGSITPAELNVVADFPTADTSSTFSNISFQAVQHFITAPVSNGTGTIYPNSGGNPIIRRLYFTYTWGAGNRYTFATEIAANTNIALP